MRRSTFSRNSVKATVGWTKWQTGNTPTTYLFGHSGGGQFLSRVTAYEPPGAEHTNGVHAPLKRNHPGIRIMKNNRNSLG